MVLEVADGREIQNQSIGQVVADGSVNMWTTRYLLAESGRQSLCCPRGVVCKPHKQPSKPLVMEQPFGLAFRIMRLMEDALHNFGGLKFASNKTCSSFSSTIFEVLRL